MRKRARVHMLATEGESHITKGSGAHLFYLDQAVSMEDNSIHESQHLYITTDEEIKEGDWFIHTFQNRIFQCLEEDSEKLITKDYPLNCYPVSEYTKKIIATTDLKLVIDKGSVVGTTHGGMIEQEADIIEPLPQPPKAFIEDYCKQGGIDEVEVEYEWSEIKQREVLEVYDNEITIHPIKKSWAY